MRNKLTKIALAVFGLAITIFLSCSDYPPLRFPSEEDMLSRAMLFSSSGEPSSSSVVPSSSSAESSSSGGLSSSSSEISSSSAGQSSSSLKECTDAIINPSTHFCYDGIVYDNCNGMPYVPTRYICVGNVITLAKCNDTEYNPLTQRCENGILDARCGSGGYDASNQNLRCQNNVIETKCGDRWYDATAQFCYESSKVGNFCGINPQKYYDPDLYECKSGKNGIYLKGGITDSRDNKHYDAVLIGTQIWMAENLNYNTNASKCYDNQESKCTTHGRLYDWTTADTVCLDGWHLPSDAEWYVLMYFVDATVGTKLKATSGWNSNGNGTDAYGFAAMPGGYSSYNAFYKVGSDGYWWSANYNSYVLASCWTMNLSDGLGIIGDRNRSILQSVRCLKNN